MGEESEVKSRDAKEVRLPVTKAPKIKLAATIPMQTTEISGKTKISLSFLITPKLILARFQPLPSLPIFTHP